MDYLVMKALFQLMIDKSHREFIKAIISIETDVEDEDQLNRLYDFYMEDDDMSLLNYALVEQCLWGNLPQRLPTPPSQDNFLG